ncbi:hypothetical protein MN608_10693 [Microdochium nivale]|nr:hypothetical protein MN608_10693 [Microdochium nivale]
MATDRDRLRTNPFHIPEELPKEMRESLARPINQPWTTTGYPIVDGKYNDFSERRIREVTAGDACRSGPPTIDVYWHNSWASLHHDTFLVRRDAYMEAGGVTSYVAKLGDFFKQAGNKVELFSLNVTTFSVIVLIGTELSNAEVMELYEGCGLGKWHGRKAWEQQIVEAQPALG